MKDNSNFEHCPSFLLIAQYTEGQLDAVTAEQVKTHMARCESCRNESSLSVLLSSRATKVLRQFNPLA